MKILTMLLIVLASASAFSFDRVQYFNTTKEVIGEKVASGAIDNVDATAIFRLTLSIKSIRTGCYGKEWDEMTPSCILPECEDMERCPKVGEDMLARAAVATGSYLAGRYGTRIADAVMDRVERKITESWERSNREIRERVDRERRERNEIERCAHGAGSLRYGCDH